MDSMDRTCFVQYIKIIQNHQILAINFSSVLLVHDLWLGGHDFMATSFTGSGKFGPPSQLRWWNVRGILALLGFQSLLETDRCRFCRSCSFLLSRFACYCQIVRMQVEAPDSMFPYYHHIVFWILFDQHVSSTNRDECYTNSKLLANCIAQNLCLHWFHCMGYRVFR